MNRFRRMGLLILVGVLVIIFAALSIVYLQQGARQRELGEQINKLSLTLLKPLPNAEKLQAEYDKVNRSLSPLTREGALDIYKYIDKIVGIAEESGIDVDPDSGKFNIPAQNLVGEVKVGEGNYQFLSFKNIRVQGDYDSVMAFISNLESGETLKTLALKTADTSQVELTVSGEEKARRAEFNEVRSAVIAMMVDNALAEIPNPINYAGGTATNLMGDDPDTAVTVEGFPDITTTAADKGYTGTGIPRDGYVLYEYDKIDPDDTTTYSTVSYISTLKTTYYYTCEADGIVRQFDSPDVATATEYLTNEEFKDVQSAIIAMMVDNALTEIPVPINYAGGTATNLMGDDPETAETVEGFPNITTTVADKGYTGTDTPPRDGYVLYQHDKIDPDDTTTYTTVSYIFVLGTELYLDVLGTEYYYTCETDGTVRQFDSPDVATATEYPHSEDEVKIETIATLDVDIYTKSGGEGL